MLWPRPGFCRVPSAYRRGGRSRGRTAASVAPQSHRAPMRTAAQFPSCPSIRTRPALGVAWRGPGSPMKARPLIGVPGPVLAATSASTMASSAGTVARGSSRRFSLLIIQSNRIGSGSYDCRGPHIGPKSRRADEIFAWLVVSTSLGRGLTASCRGARQASPPPQQAPRSVSRPPPTGSPRHASHWKGAAHREPLPRPAARTTR